MGTRAVFDRAWQRVVKDPALFFQAGLLAACWLYVVWLHRDNDGLWEADAARHAANGLFWQDFLRDLPRDCKGYALSYFARYPVIKPSAYPPLVYWMEAALFAAFGPNPHVAKLLVSAFGLCGGVLTLAWIRRWISPHAGWIASLLLLLPAIVTRSHSIMLNLPAMTMGLATLYFVQRCLDSDAPRSRRRSMFLACSFALLSVGTYFLAIAVFPVAVLWLFGRRAPRRPNWRWWVVAIAVLGAGASTGLLFQRLAPTHFSWIVPDVGALFRLEPYLFYARRMPALFGPATLTIATIGALFGLAHARLRSQTTSILIWLVTLYILLSVIPARSGRYFLFAAPTVVLLAAIAVVGAADHIRRLFSFSRRAHERVMCAGALAMVIGHLAAAHAVSVPAVKGIREAADFYRQIGPNEPILYDGASEGIFTFYVRAADPNYQRQVVRGGKLLYAYAIHEGYRLREFVHSVEEVKERLASEGGCRLLAVEVHERPETIEAKALLRKAVQGKDYQLIRSFTVVSEQGRYRIDFYRCIFDIEPMVDVRLPLPILGENVEYRAIPIARRNPD